MFSRRIKPPLDFAHMAALLKIVDPTIQTLAGPRISLCLVSKINIVGMVN